MPTISIFYGISVMMNLTLKEHNPPHVHAKYAEYEATFKIENGELYHGRFPEKAKKLVKEFIISNKEELLSMWNNKTYYQLKGIE